MLIRKIRGLSIRIRLAGWYALAVALALGVALGAVYISLSRTLDAQLAADLRQSTQVLAEKLEHEFGEGEQASYACEELIRKSPFRSLSIEIYDPTQQMIFASPDLGERRLASAEILGSASSLGSEPAVTRVDDPALDASGVDVTAVRVPYPGSGDVYTVVVGAQRAPIVAALSAVKRIVLVITPLLLLLAALAGAWLAQRALSPVASMTGQARRMGSDRLSERLVAPNPADELGQLATTFNELLDRIQSSFDRMRQFVADASHELRTPVAVIQSATEATLMPPVSADECRDTLVVIGEETARLTRLIDDMFTLARADAGDFGNRRSDVVEVASLVNGCLRAAEALGRVRGVSVEAGARLKAEAAVRGDGERLRQMLMNLLDNAVKYAGEEGRVRVDATLVDEDRQTWVEISVRDTGPGIPEIHHDAIFERFFRVDRARTRNTGGSGLGLPIARLIAESHGGSLRLAGAGESGCVFVVRLPIASHDGERAEPFTGSSSRVGRIERGTAPERASIRASI
jgi:heavy metal sensor kinase